MVEIKHKTRASKDDSFTLASQAQQVYYVKYVSEVKDHKAWHVAIKIKARSRIDYSHTEHADLANLVTNDVFQQDEQHAPTRVQSSDHLDDPLVIVDTENFVVCNNVRRQSDHKDGNDDDDEESEMRDNDDDDKMMNPSSRRISSFLSFVLFNLVTSNLFFILTYLLAAAP